MDLLTAEQMRECDRKTIDDLGIPGAVLMENAGRAAVAELLECYPHLAPGPVLVVAGRGNNGGDGFVMALTLQDLGWQVRTLALAANGQVTGDASLHLQALQQAGGEVIFVDSSEALTEQLAGVQGAALVVDAIFGTGLSTPVRGLAETAINWINAFSGPVVAVDMPSGVDASNGRICGCAVKADLTVSFAFGKVGQYVYPGADRVGTLRIVDIGIPRQFAATRSAPVSLVTAATARGLFPPRSQTAHKGSFGHLLLVAGSRGKTGAAALAAEAALRVGAGLVSLAVPAAVQPILAARLLEVMTEPIGLDQPALGAKDIDQLLQLTRDKQALAIGPGLGTAEQTVELVARLISETAHPLVLDADGLNALATRRHLLKNLRDRAWVLTPHPGEMARLSGLTIAQIEADRIAVAREFAVAHRVVLVLKGARTIIALPDRSVFVNSTGNPGMASGGMGDVLTGIIGGLLAQGMDAGEAARLGVFWHGLAADLLSATMGNSGLLASDLTHKLPEARQGILQNGDEEC